MVCIKCRHTIRDGAAFCPNCGWRCESNVVPPMPMQAAIPEPTEKKQKRILPVVCGMIGVAVLLLACIVYLSIAG